MAINGGEIKGSEWTYGGLRNVSYKIYNALNVGRAWDRCILPGLDTYGGKPISTRSWLSQLNTTPAEILS